MKKIRHGIAAAASAMALVAAVVFPAAVPGPAHAAAPALPALDIDPAGIGVSGLSSGGFMAVQMHVIHSATFLRGAGVVAGGPFLCARGNVALALGPCMVHGLPLPVDSLAQTTRDWAAEGRIDPVAHLKGSHVYLFSGSRDAKVNPGVVADLRDYYRQFMPAGHIELKTSIAAGHAMVTEDAGTACATSEPPYINDCDFDLAGAILAQVHGPLAARNDGALTGRLAEFDQTAFVTGHGMGASGYLFVPKACESGPRCRLHVVFHGCHQSARDIGDQYARTTGYNRWADTNRIVVLYPQTGEGATNGCWDWWGYDSPLYAQKTGPQVRAVKAMVDRLAGGASPAEPVCFTATNSEHVRAGRAHYWWGAVLAEGSRQVLGWAFSTTTLKQLGPGLYEQGSCA